MVSIATAKKNVFQELERIRFPKTKTRKNVSNDSQEAFALGTVNYRGQAFLNYQTMGQSQYNKKHPDLYRAIKNLISTCKPEFKYTTIQVNKNVLSLPHVDKNNVGPSYIIGLGNYTGGELVIEGKRHNIKNRWKYFDGNKGHWVEPFQGTRYTLVFFTHTFKPPCATKRFLEVTKTGLYNRGELVTSY